MLIPVSGLLADRVGRKSVLIVGLLCFGLGGIGIAFTNDFEATLKLRVLQDPGFADITPVIITLLCNSGDTEAAAQGIRFIITGLSQAVFPVIAGAIVVLGWQCPFVIYGLLIPIALLVAVLFNEPTAAGDAGSSHSLLRGDYIGKNRAIRSPTAHRLVPRRASYRRVAVLFFPHIQFGSYRSTSG